MSIVSTKDIAYSNKRAVIKALCEKNALSRVELARELSLSPSTVTTIVQDLLQSKMVEESSERVVTAGRSKTLLQLAPEFGLLGLVRVSRQSQELVLVDMALNEYARTTLSEEAPSGETLLEGIKTALTRLIVDGAILKGIGVLLEGDVLESELSVMYSTGHDSATISLVQALKSTFRVVVKQFEQSDFALSQVESSNNIEGVSSYLHLSFGSRVVAQVVCDNVPLPMKEGLNADITQQLVTSDGLQLDALMNLISAVQSLFSVDAVVVSVPEEDGPASLLKTDALNKALSTPALLVQKFAQFEEFPKLIVTRMTSRNLLRDAVSALRFACLCPETVQLWKQVLVSGWHPVSSV
ncbi:MAG: winged helix-turn-helix domain-containing protein [Atopobium sp.]|nr:winged helix-turn-helix domain-containing protein [Atopobium sp.]